MSKAFFYGIQGLAWAVRRYLEKEAAHVWNRDRRANEASMAGENYQIP